MDGLRARQVRILRAFVEHCQAHELRYYLCAGTLLGAVRHHGYIPWDDDIDVMMPRPDYEALCRTFAATGEPLKLRALAISSDGHYPLPFAKICDLGTRLDVESDIVKNIGVFIDVFPLDGWHNRSTLRWLQRIVLASLLNAILAKHLVLGRSRRPHRAIALAMAKLAVLPVPAQRLAKAVDRIAQLGEFDACINSAVLVWGKFESVPTQAFGEPETFDFEGQSYAGPHDADAYLRVMYGDYMTLPPAEKRVTNHRFRAYAVDGDLDIS